MTRAVISLADVRARMTSYRSDNREVQLRAVFVYGQHDGTPFIAQGQMYEGGGWQGLWSWTCAKRLGDSARQAIIRAIKASPLTAAALGAAVPGCDEAFVLDFFLSHGDKHVVPYADTERRAALKAAGATFFKVQPEPFWFTLK